MKMSSVGERIREERERLGLTSKAFHTAGEVSKNTQTRYENNERSPDAAYLQRLATFGVDVLYVITGQRNENVATTPIELSFLRICRALPTHEARMAGNAALVALLSALGTQLGASEATNENQLNTAQKGINNE